MYRGFWASAWRDVPGWAIYFACFEKLKEMGTKMNLNEKQKVLWVINAGGIAGLLSWVFSMP